MRKFFPVDSLARDSRFNQITMRQSQADRRKLTPIARIAGVAGIVR